MCRAGFDVGVAHCNFHLRPGDCDRDEAFVRHLAANHSLPCFVAQFNTVEYANAEGLSVEEAARRLRYRFFEEIRMREGYSLIATAHHRDDAIETFFINLLRGSGIAGLHGIPQRNGAIVRPLLPFGRDEIDAYVASRGLQYVEDVTNAQPLYLRNRIRLQLLPLLRDISPSFDAVMENNMQHLADADTIYQGRIEELKRHLCVDGGKGEEEQGGEKGRAVVINISELRKCQPLPTILFELLRPFGFNSAVSAQIAASLDAQSGRQFFSPTHRLVKDRENLIITVSQSRSDNTAQQQGDSCLLYEDLDYRSLPISLSISVFGYEGKVPRLPKNEAWFDKGKLLFPLLLRRWRDGDRFRPFGMKGTRLVSDLFSDLKLSLDEKENAWLLCNGDGTILWVVGHRASQFAAIDHTTKEVVGFKLWR